MKTDKKIITVLNDLLKSQLTGINQYFLHARMFRSWGLDELNNRHYHVSIKLMKEADTVIERILFLEGLPNLQSLGKLGIGENVSECITSDLSYELESQRKSLQTVVSVTEAEKDFVSAKLARHLLQSCEENIDHLETQLSLIDDLGLANYLQSQVHTHKGE
jgi:bacterioferritin